MKGSVNGSKRCLKVAPPCAGIPASYFGQAASGLPEWEEEGSHNDHLSSRGMLDREQYAVQRAHERILCQECQRFHDEPCWLHVKFVPDCSRLVGPLGTASLPEILYLDDLHSSSTGKIVRAKETVFAQTVFGPLIAPLSDVRNDTCIFASPDPKGVGMRYYQLESEEQSNWMRYVRFVENPAIANLAAYLRGHQVVFVSMLLILPGEELTVCHSTKYARIIGRVPLEIKKEENDCSFFPEVPHNFSVRGPSSPELQSSSTLSTTRTQNSGVNYLDSVSATIFSSPHKGHNKPTVYSRIVQRIIPSPENPYDHRHSSPEIEPEKRILRSSTQQPHSTMQTSPSVGFADLPFQSIDDPDQDPDFVLEGCSDDDDDDDEDEMLIQKGSRFDTWAEAMQEFDVYQKRTFQVFSSLKSRKLPSTHDRSHDIVYESAEFVCMHWSGCEARKRGNRVSTPKRTYCDAKVIFRAQLCGKGHIEVTKLSVHHTHNLSKDSYTNDKEMRKRSEEYRKEANESVQKDVPSSAVVTPLRQMTDTAVRPKDIHNIRTHVDQGIRREKGEGLNSVQTPGSILCRFPVKVLARKSDEPDAQIHGEPLTKHFRSMAENTSIISASQLNSVNDRADSPEIFGPSVNQNIRTMRTTTSTAENLSAVGGNQLICAFSTGDSQETFIPTVNQNIGTVDIVLGSAEIQDSNSTNTEVVQKHNCYLCGICGTHQRNRASLAAHRRSVHRTRGDSPTPESQREGMDYIMKTGYLSYYCASCKVYFHKKNLLDLHALSHEPVEDSAEQGKECPECDFVGTSLDDLVQHVTEHSIPSTGYKQCLFCAARLLHLSRAHYLENHPDEWKIIQQSFDYKCDQCGKRFFSSNSLSTHLSHCPVAGKVYWCVCCCAQYKNQKKFSEHIRLHRTDGFFSCLHCSAKYETYAHLRGHCRMMHKNEYGWLEPKAHSVMRPHQPGLEYLQRTGFLSYFCPVCRLHFPSMAVLDLHEFGHKKEDYSSKTEVDCPLCDFVGISFGDLINHTAEHGVKGTINKAESEKIQCLLCDKKTLNLVQHYSFQHSDCHVMEIRESKIPRSRRNKRNPFRSLFGRKSQCLYCPTKLRSPHDFSRHVRQHEMDGTYPCPLCAKGFPSYTDMRQNYRRDHPAEFRLPRCKQSEQTGIITEQPELTESHRKGLQYIRKTGFLSYYCRTCRKHFPSEQILDLHMLSHQEEYPAGEERSCPLCDFFACSFADLVDHAAEHGATWMGNKRQCLFCDDQLVQLRPHYRSAHGELCKEIFEEMRMHSEEQGHRTRGVSPTPESQREGMDYMLKTGYLSYYCASCRVYFHKKNLLDLHALSHEPVEDSAEQGKECPECDFVGTSLDDLVQHVTEHSIPSTGYKQCLLCAARLLHLSRAHYLENHPEEWKIIQQSFDYKCDQCGKRFFSSKSLSIHLTTCLVPVASRGFSCVCCSAQYKNREKFSEHVRLHRTDGFFSCLHCSAKYERYAQLRGHCRIMHKKDFGCLESGAHSVRRPYQPGLEYLQRTGFLSYFCPICRLHFPSMAVLDLHELGHKKEVYPSKTEADCPLCDFVGSSFGDLVNHTAEHGVKGTFYKAGSEKIQCLLCDKQTDSLMRHYKLQHSDCHVMEIIASKFPRSGRHQKGNPSRNRIGRAFQCLYCPTEFRFSVDFSRHVRQHEMDGTYPCPLCAKRFASYTDMRQNYRRDHPADFRMFDKQSEQTDLPTEQPEVTESDRKALEYIRKTGYLSYYCGKCKKHFSSEKILDLHMLGHQKECPAGEERSCPECDFCAGSFADLVAHAADHGISSIGYKRQCLFCDDQLVALGGHYRTAHGEICKEVLEERKLRMPERREFQCDQCQRKFSKELNMRQHVCPGKRPEEQETVRASCTFRCLYCAADCRSGTGLHLHLQMHKLDGRFPCPSCSYAHGKYQQMRGHFIRKHSRRSVPQQSNDTALVAELPDETCAGNVVASTSFAEDAVSRAEITPTGSSSVKLDTLMKINVPTSRPPASKKKRGRNKLLVRIWKRKPVECEYCGMVVTRGALWKHKRSQHRAELVGKDLKNQQKSDPISYPRRRMAFEEFPFRCEECHFGYLQQFTFDKHMAKKHPSSMI